MYIYIYIHIILVLLQARQLSKYMHIYIRTYTYMLWIDCKNWPDLKPFNSFKMDLTALKQARQLITGLNGFETGQTALKRSGSYKSIRNIYTHVHAYTCKIEPI